MRLLNLELNGFKSFAKKSNLDFENSIVCIVGPNGSGKSNVVEAFRFVLGEQSMKSMRGKAGADLVFKGSKSLSKVSRAKVVAHFNNKDRVFKITVDDGRDINLNFDTISIGREVFSDGVNKYLLNSDEVRLKDINSILASLNIGSSGHHIISQGETDRILNTNSRERKEMIEDALGLKIYQYKIRESERKLERAQENMKEVSMLRRENAPHLRYLKKQVEKFQQMKELKQELSKLYRDYLSKESVYISSQKASLGQEQKELQAKTAELTEKLDQKEEKSDEVLNKKLNELKEKEKQLSELQNTKNELERKLGRVEGMLEVKLASVKERSDRIFTKEEVDTILDEVENLLENALKESSLDEVKNILSTLKNSVSGFRKSSGGNTDEDEKTKELEFTQEAISKDIKDITNKEEKLIQEVSMFKQQINEMVEESRDMEREKFELKVKNQELQSRLELNQVRIEALQKKDISFSDEIREGRVLIGQEVEIYKLESVKSEEVDEKTQEENRKKIERIKIKLEDAGLGNEAEVMAEYKEVSERDEFLAKELVDLETSIGDLEKIIAELKEKVEAEFSDGIKNINKEFQEFFETMFGGGNAKIFVVEVPVRGVGEEDEENKKEPGVEIDVKLPHKKTRGLHLLSGGERALTSIALLFAMTQVNPPPFLILDETDAALDEANSRKYGDMLERLSKHSQLIVVTHNRETMSRADVLYGITIGADGASKLLSVKFDEAVSIAK